jgi:hypothetical protein
MQAAVPSDDEQPTRGGPHRAGRTRAAVGRSGWPRPRPSSAGPWFARRDRSANGGWGTAPYRRPTRRSGKQHRHRAAVVVPSVAAAGRGDIDVHARLPLKAEETTTESSATVRSVAH